MKRKLSIMGMVVLTVIAPVALVTLSACGPTAPIMDPLTFEYLPPELKDCKFYYLRNREYSSLKVVRCPNSATTATYTEGKTTVSTVVIDGKEYVEKK